jgi:H+-transporting ATPase
VFPEHKFLIVEALRQKGYSCGMTGDGVNDAPALKRADVGIAVQGATDAARAAADLILTAPGLSVIVDAIIISRCIFQRMKNYVIYRVACTIQLLAFFFLAVLTIHPKDYEGVGDSTFFNLPVVALVVITILNDGTIISIAYDHVEPSPRPERWNLPILFAVATWLGVVAVASSMLLLHLALSSHDPDSLFQTTFGIKDLSMPHVKCMVYLKISLSDFFTVFTARTQGFFWERAPGGLLMACAVLATVSSTLLSLNWPFGEVQDDGSMNMSGIDSGLAVFTWVYCLIWFFIQDCMKVVLYKLLYQFDVSGLRTESEKCAERAFEKSPESRIGKVEEELSKMKQVCEPSNDSPTYTLITSFYILHPIFQTLSSIP